MRLRSKELELENEDLRNFAHVDSSIPRVPVVYVRLRRPRPRPCRATRARSLIYHNLTCAFVRMLPFKNETSILSNSPFEVDKMAKMRMPFCLRWLTVATRLVFHSLSFI